MRNCNRVFVLCFLVLIICPISIGEEFSKPAPLRLEIKADKDVYGPDEPIYIDIRITNTRKIDLGPGKSHLVDKDDSLYVFIPKKIHVALVGKGKNHFELSAGSISLDDNTKEKLLVGKLEPLEKEDFISIPPGYFYSRKFDIPAEANVRGKLTCSYRNRPYSEIKTGITAWTGTIKSNILNIGSIQENSEKLNDLDAFLRMGFTETETCKDISATFKKIEVGTPVNLFQQMAENGDLNGRICTSIVPSKELCKQARVSYISRVDYESKKQFLFLHDSQTVIGIFYREVTLEKPRTFEQSSGLKQFWLTDRSP